MIRDVRHRAPVSRWPRRSSAACRRAASTLEEVIVTATRSPAALATTRAARPASRPATIELIGATHSSELAEPRGRRDDPARQRPGIADGAALAGADRRRRLRRRARARGRHPDPAGRHLQRQRAVRGQPRAGRRRRDPARAGQRAVRLERRARHHQRDPAAAATNSRRSASRSRPAATTTGGSASRPRTKHGGRRFGIALHATDDGGWRDSSGFDGAEAECRVGAGRYGTAS